MVSVGTVVAVGLAAGTVVVLIATIAILASRMSQPGPALLLAARGVALLPVATPGLLGEPRVLFALQSSGEAGLTTIEVAERPLAHVTARVSVALVDSTACNTLIQPPQRLSDPRRDTRTQTVLLARPDGGSGLSNAADIDLGPSFQGTEGWALHSDGNQVLLYFSVPMGICWPWVWIPLITLTLPDGRAGAYAFHLIPGPRAPWTHAVLDLGRWHTLLPQPGPPEPGVEAQLITPTTTVFINQYTTRPTGRDIAVASMLNLPLGKTVFVGCALGQGNRTRMCVRPGPGGAAFFGYVCQT